MPNINSALIGNLIDQASQSTLQQHLAAAVVQNNKQLSSSVCNSHRNLCRGQYIPSLHAEQRALLSYYGLKINYNSYKGWYFYDPDYKAKKIEVAVVRVTRNGDFANARPCRKCVAMMKDLGVKRVHYSSGMNEEIITENIRDMFSINDSSSARHFARSMFNYPKNDKEYFKYLLKKNAPKNLKVSSLNNFIRFNFELLPTCRYSFQKIKGKMYFKIQEKDDTLVLINIL
jgi:deoxycytidylate deaminase